MAITNGYLTLAEAKSDLAITDTADDTSIERAVNAASRLIDEWCGQRFWQDTEATTRYFTAQTPHSLWLVSAGADVQSRTLTSVTSVTLDTSGDGTFDESWTADTEYFLAPRGAVAASRPYDELVTLPAYRFPRYRDAVKVVGVFGWAAVPVEVKEACAIQAATLFKRTTEGAAPIVTIDGTTLRSSKFLDLQAQMLLRPYRLPVVA